MRLQGRVTAITGGALGIGRATGLAFAAEGALVALGDVEHEAAEAVAREIREGGGQAIAVRVDVGDAGQVQAFVEAVVALPESVTPAGSGSETVTSAASVRPVLPTVTVYVAVPPGV